MKIKKMEMKESAKINKKWYCIDCGQSLPPHHWRYWGLCVDCAYMRELRSAFCHWFYDELHRALRSGDKETLEQLWEIIRNFHEGGK